MKSNYIPYTICIVEAIEAYRFKEKPRRVEFLIKWEGYAASGNKWKPARHLKI
jgi:hypothetical protein